jgi:hypothetical protein
MPIHAKKNSFLVLALILPCQMVLAQTVPEPPSPGATAPAAAPAAVSAPAPVTVNVPQPTQQNQTEIDSSSSQALDYLFNHKAGEGTAAKAGSEVASALADKIKAVDVLKTPGLDDPEVRARFQTYLSLKEVAPDRIKDYFGKMAQVSDLLQAGDTFNAWKTLYAMSEYKDLDAGISRELANRVESIWNSDQTKNRLEISNTTLQNNIETYNHNADMMAEDIQDQANVQATKAKGNAGGGNNNNSGVSAQNATNSPLANPNADPAAAEAELMPTMTSGLQGKMELTGEYLKLLEARAKVKLNQMQENKMTDQDRLNFADYIKTLYNSHRYYHVIIAADFYRCLFNEGDYPADLADQAAASLGTNARTLAQSATQASAALGNVTGSGPLSALNQIGNNIAGDHAGKQQGGQPITLADEVTASLEINNRVSQAIEVFRYKADKGEIAAAAEQLQEAFLGNEYHPALQGLPRDEKEKVGDFLGKLEVLKNQLEVRDFEQVEGQIADIKKIAVDFDSTKPMAMVNDIKLSSRLRLGKARLLAQGGHLNESMQEFQTAAEEWPGNPDLQTSASGFFSTEDLQNQSTAEFDRLVKDQNYRAIFDRQLAFAPAVKGDATREQQLKDALTKVQKAEMASEKANLMMMNGDVDGAWETIEIASKDWPDDMKLNKLLANLSGRSADFVSALNKARDAEAKKELGYSLTWYVNAQGYYPASIIANDGIDRVSKQILSPDSSSSPAPVGTN